MNTRKLFADTINTLGSHSNLSANECERFGMTWGCRIDCPLFERGECNNDDPDAFFKTINKEDEEVKEYFLNLYPQFKIQL